MDGAQYLALKGADWELMQLSNQAAPQEACALISHPSHDFAEPCCSLCACRSIPDMRSAVEQLLEDVSFTLLQLPESLGCALQGVQRLCACKGLVLPPANVSFPAQSLLRARPLACWCHARACVHPKKENA